MLINFLKKLLGPGHFVCMDVNMFHFKLNILLKNKYNNLLLCSNTYSSKFIELNSKEVLNPGIVCPWPSVMMKIENYNIRNTIVQIIEKLLILTKKYVSLYTRVTSYHMYRIFQKYVCIHLY